MSRETEATSAESTEKQGVFDPKKIVGIQRPGETQITKIQKEETDEEDDDHSEEGSSEEGGGDEEEEEATQASEVTEEVESDDQEQSGQEEESQELESTEEEIESTSEESSQEDFNIYEFTEGEFESKEDLKKIANLFKEAPELKGMLDFYEKNGTLLPYLQATQVDVDKFSDIEILQQAFKHENADAGLTDEELLLLFEDEVMSKYSLDSDDETKIKLGQIRLRREAEKLRKELKEEQKALLLPKDREDAGKAKQQAESERKSKLEAQKNKLAFQIRKEVKDGKMEVKVSEEISVTLNVSPKKITELLDKTPDPSLFVDKTGRFDIRKMAMLADMDGFLNSVVNISETSGTKKFINKELRNRPSGGKSPLGQGAPNRVEKLDPRDPKSFKGAKIISRP